MQLGDMPITSPPPSPRENGDDDVTMMMMMTTIPLDLGSGWDGSFAPFGRCRWIPPLPYDGCFSAQQERIRVITSQRGGVRAGWSDRGNAISLVLSLS
jgi:hypothetical protein